jgi:branched-chain amino acid transport system permease protein
MADVPELAKSPRATLWRKTLFHAGVFGLALVLVALLAPAIESLTDFRRNILLEVGLNIILTVSLNLILGMAGQFSLGHAGFLAAGAFTAIILAVKPEFMLPQLRLWHQTLGLSMPTSFTLIMLTGTFAGAIVAAILGLVVGLPTLRLRGDYLAIATLGFGEILGEIVRNVDYIAGTDGTSVTGDRVLWLGSQPEPLPPLLAEIQTFMASTNRHVSFFWIFAGVVLTVAIVRNIKYSTGGRALLAMREDPIASESVGIPTTRYKVAAFIIGAALAGMAGGFLSHKDLIEYELPRFPRSFMIVAMVILGGQGSITGSIAAAILLTLVPEQLRVWNFEKSRLIIFSLVIVFSMLFRPQGIFGRYEITDLLGWLYKKALRHKGAEALREEGESPAPAPLSVSMPQSLRASPSPADTPLLVATNVTMQFGGLKAVDTFNLILLPRELVGLIGPNGAGKTTAFNVLTGVYKPTAGKIDLCGKSIVSLKPHAISHRGIARTFQNIRLFANLSVLDNVMIAQHAHHKEGIPSAVLRTPAFYAEEALSEKSAMEYLNIFDLGKFAQERANSLSYGDQRRLEIARALATRPKILLLDEPAAGMNPTEKRDLMDLIREIQARFNLTILLIEHDMKVIMGVCQRIIVLDYGKTIAQGSPDQIRKNPAVIQAYLGAPAKQE